jgi:hypothetical protein
MSCLEPLAYPNPFREEEEGSDSCDDMDICEKVPASKIILPRFSPLINRPYFVQKIGPIAAGSYQSGAPVVERPRSSPIASSSCQSSCPNRNSL